MTCQLCFDSFEGPEAAENMTRVDVCGHMFCNNCWRHHLKVRIHDEGEGAKIMCAGESQLENGKSGRCNIVLDEQVVERLLKQGSDKDLLKRYCSRLVDTYVNNNPTVKWCPFTDCTVGASFPSKSCRVSCFTPCIPSFEGPVHPSKSHLAPHPSSLQQTRLPSPALENWKYNQSPITNLVIAFFNLCTLPLPLP